VDNIPKQETEVQSDTTKKLLQTSSLRLRWIWTEASIWTDNMLTALENGVKGNRWFSLIDKVYRPGTLLAAWEKVRANRGCAGIDRVTIEKFASQEYKYLEELADSIKTGNYVPKSVKRIHIPKEKGKTRPLGIPSVIDRVAQQAVKLVIEPIFEKEFLEVSYGFRPGRGAKDALREVDRLIKEGYTFVVDADLQSYFDTIPHLNLMEKLSSYISDGRLLNLVEKWLKQDIMEDCKLWKPLEGTPQGAVLSPLLSNLYLHDLDKTITAAGGKMIRYADDFVILNRSQAEAEDMMSLVKTWVTMNGLKLHPEKTHIGNCLVKGQGFEFLGYRFEAGERRVRNKSTQKFRDKIKALTPRSCGKAVIHVIRKLNQTLRGWYEYFKHVHHKWGLNPEDAFVRRRLRAILRRNEKRPGHGKTFEDHRRWPNDYFAKLGLFAMEKFRRLEIASRPR
jgi:RNA-directed DNA polymerase